MLIKRALIQVKAGEDEVAILFGVGRRWNMTNAGWGMLILIVGALTLFAGTLGWASWQESRDRKRGDR